MRERSDPCLFVPIQFVEALMTAQELAEAARVIPLAALEIQPPNRRSS